jgi:hypothetical protein
LNFLRAKIYRLYFQYKKLLIELTQILSHKLERIQAFYKKIHGKRIVHIFYCCKKCKVTFLIARNPTLGLKFRQIIKGQGNPLLQS